VRSSAGAGSPKYSKLDYLADRSASWSSRRMSTGSHDMQAPITFRSAAIEANIESHEVEHSAHAAAMLSVAISARLDAATAALCIASVYRWTSLPPVASPGSPSSPPSASRVLLNGDPAKRLESFVLRSSESTYAASAA